MVAPRVVVTLRVMSMGGLNGTLWICRSPRIACFDCGEFTKSNVVWLRNDKWNCYLDQGQAKCLLDQPMLCGKVTGQLSDSRIRLDEKWGLHLDQARRTSVQSNDRAKHV